MPVNLVLNETATVMGFLFPASVTLQSDGGQVKSITVPPAKSGTLSTRTSDTAGELTMGAGHGITNGARLDIYWPTGVRRGVEVGTVAGNDVPFSGGDGDDLPAQTTAVTAMVPVEEEFLVTGDDVEALLFHSARRGTIVLATAADAESTYRTLGLARSWLWTPDRDPVNPVEGDDVAKAFFSHEDAANSSVMRVAALFD